MADTPKDNEDKKEKGGLFGSKLSSWASKAKEAASSAVNIDKAKAAMDEMKKAAISAGQKASEMAKATGEKASEAAKAAEEKASSILKKDKPEGQPPEEKKDDEKLD